jgi:putative transposase
MTTGFRFRAYPDDKVAGVLARWIGCQRFVKNAKVREDRYFRAFQRRFLTFAGQYAPVDQAYSHLIGDGNPELLSDGTRAEADTLWLREVPSQVIRNGAVRFYQGYQRFYKGLARRPTITRRHGEQSVWLTEGVFRFRPVIDADGVITGQQLILGTPKHPCGVLPFIVHKGVEAWKVPASIHISVNAGRWHLSFSNDPAEDLSDYVPTAKETLDHLRTIPMGQLIDMAIGLDRGVVVPLMGAGVRSGEGSVEGKAFDFLPVQRDRFDKKQARRARWQRISARRVKGSKNRRKANHQAARAGLYAADVRKDFAHQTSRTLVGSPAKPSPIKLFVFEALKVKNMTASAAGTVAEPGKKVAQKRGLNRSILASAWGDLKLFTKYKALAAGKLCIEVPAHHSSQECSACGHTHAGNRPDQGRFLCQRCGHAENADVNAGRVIAWRGVLAVASGSYALKAKKKVGTLRGQVSSEPKGKNEDIQVGPERSEPSGGKSPSTSVEISVSRRAPRRTTHTSPKQKIPDANWDAPTRTQRV